MIKGYFVHKLPDAIPSAFGFAYVLGMLGLNKDPTFDANWLKVAHIRRGIYQRPIVNATDNAFQHSAFLIQLCQYNNPAWNDMPLLLNILIPGVDLTFINIWCDQIINALHPKEKPLLFTTLKHWGDIQKGPNAEVVSKTILQKADMMISQYRISLPSKPLYVNKLKYWEFESGKMQYASDGIFEHVIPAMVDLPDSGGAPAAVPTDPAVQPPAASTAYPIIHTCPHCGRKLIL